MRGRPGDRKSVSVAILVALVQLACVLDEEIAMAAPRVVASIPMGAAQSGIAVNVATNRIYVATADTGVSVINGSTNAVITTVGVVSPRGIAVNPNTNRIYVTSPNSDSVAVINGSTNTVTATIAVGQRPMGVTVNPVTNRVYVANMDSDSVSVIDPAANAVTTTIPLLVDIAPSGIDANSATNRIYVRDQAGSTSVIDGATDTVVATLSTPGTLTGIAVNSTTNRVYTGILNGNLAVIDGATNTVAGSVVIGATPGGIAVNPSSNRIYVASGGAGVITVINGATGAVDGTVTTGGSPFEVAVNRTTNRTYTTNPGSGEVAVIADDAAQSGQTTSVNVLPAPPAPPLLTISLTETSLAFGDLTPGSTSSAVAVGNVVYTNTLDNGTPWSATAAATSLTNGTAVVPFSAMTYSPGASVSSGPGATGALTPGPVGTFAGTDPSPGSSFSNPITLMTAPADARGEFTHPGSMVTLHVPATAFPGAYAGTLQYTITG